MSSPDATPESGLRDGSAAVADFTGLDDAGGGAAPVAAFGDLGDPDEAAGSRGCDTQDVASFGGVDEMPEGTAASGPRGPQGPAAVRTAGLDDLADDRDTPDGHGGAAGVGGLSEVRVASFDGPRPRAGRAARSRSRSERSPAATGRAAATDRADVRAPATRPDGEEPEGPARTTGSGGSRSRGRGGGGERRSGRGGGGELSFGPQDDEARAKEICLRLLTDRARTVQELSQALRRKEIPDEVAQRVLERFDEVGLVDDQAFAGQWVRSRHTQRGLGRRAIAAELHRKGVAKEIADEALTEIDAESEEIRARQLVDRKLRTVSIATKEQRVTAARRLVGMLARKGYGGDIAYRVVREAIAEHGAEEDELGEGPYDQ